MLYASDHVFRGGLGQLLGGVTVIEAVFNYRGIGNMMFEGGQVADYHCSRGALAFTITILTLNILTEFLYPLLDPRLREDGMRWRLWQT